MGRTHQPSEPSHFEKAVGKVVGDFRSLAIVEPREERRRDREQKLAYLRRGLGADDGWHPAVAMVINPHIQEDWNLWPDELAALYQAGALFGSYPHVTESGPRRTSFAKSLNLLAQARAKEKGALLDEIRAPLNRQLLALLDSHQQELFPRLRHMVALLDGSEKKIGIDWAQLSKDIARWDHPEQTVQRTWARDWWSAQAAQQVGAENAEQIEEGAQNAA